MPPKRSAASAALAAKEEDIKKLRSAIDQAAEDYLCPISQELPVDPVTAEDGRIYERTEIQRHIDQRAGSLRSPMTNEPMGPKLLPSAQTRSIIRTLVRTGAIGGDKATRWEERLNEEEKLQTWRREAEGGDCYAMYELGCAHWYGTHGLNKDQAAAYGWWKKGADHNNPTCMAVAGRCLLFGKGVDKAVTHGIHLLTGAAWKGSRNSCYHLGVMYEKRMHGLPKDAAQAKYWFARTADGAIDDINDQYRDNAAARLQALTAAGE